MNWGVCLHTYTHAHTRTHIHTHILCICTHAPLFFFNRDTDHLNEDATTTQHREIKSSVHCARGEGGGGGGVFGDCCFLALEPLQEVAHLCSCVCIRVCVCVCACVFVRAFMRLCSCARAIVRAWERVP